MTDTLEIFGTEYTGVAGVKATDDNAGTKTYIRPQGTKSITSNGNGIDVAEYAAVDVNVSGGGSNLQAKTNISPTTSSQTITPDTGYDGLSSVQINAMPSGTAGTPTATKGEVSDNSLEVTPSVTNTTGYITGGTKTGTAVTVSASELVSGTYSVTSSGTQTVTNYKYISVQAGSQGTPAAVKGTVSNHAIQVRPTVSNGAGWIGGGALNGSAVTVTASELVSGSQTITSNNTYDVTNLAEVVVNVSGGSSNMVQGTFSTGTTTGTTGSVTLSYSGSGYPIAAMVFVDGGAYNSAVSGWYNSVQRYAVGQWTFSKSVQTSTPTYTTSGAANQGVTTWIYKNSTSQATTYSRSSAMTTNVLTSSSTNATGAGATCVRFKGNGKTLNYYVASTSYGLLANTTYKYIVIYSS